VSYRFQDQEGDARRRNGQALCQGRIEAEGGLSSISQTVTPAKAGAQLLGSKLVKKAGSPPSRG